MIRDLITAFLVAFAAVTASEVLTRIWDVLTGSVDGACAYVRHCIRSA